jgi:hypothetical protein
MGRRRPCGLVMRQVFVFDAAKSVRSRTHGKNLPRHSIVKNGVIFPAVANCAGRATLRYRPRNTLDPELNRIRGARFSGYEEIVCNKACLKVKDSLQLLKPCILSAVAAYSFLPVPDHQDSAATMYQPSHLYLYTYVRHLRSRCPSQASSCYERCAPRCETGRYK